MTGNRRRRDQGGAAAVEFALIAPILLLLVFGIIQYGLYFWAAQGGSSAAREAARRAAVGELPTCDAYRDYIKTKIGSLGDEDSAVITRTYANGPDHDDLTQVEVGDLVTVSVTFDSIDLHIPLVPFIHDGQVEESAAARVENVPTAPESCS